METGKAYIEQAVMLDKQQRYEEAIQLYRDGSRCILKALDFEKNPYVVKNARERVNEYIERAEKLKSSLDKKQKEPAGGDKDSGDKESEKLKGQLAQAIVTEKPNVKWSDVAGLDAAKDELKISVILPVVHPEFFAGKRKPWSGVLLYGPPGTGKSYLAKAVATEANGTFMSVSSSDLVSKWQGESARLVKAMFQMAREKKPTVIFIDEIDSLCGSRDDSNSSGGQRQVLNEFLVQMDGVGKDQSDVLVLGATNLPWQLDNAIRRRFQKRIYIPLPDEKARSAMFKIHFGSEGHNLDQSDFDELAKHTNMYSGSDISTMVKTALMIPVKRVQKAKYFVMDKNNIWHPCSANTPGAVNTDIFSMEGKVEVPTFTKEDIPDLLKKAPNSISPSELKRYEDWTAEFGEEGV